MQTTNRKTPIQVDEMISADLHAETLRVKTLERELDWARARVKVRQDQIACEHNLRALDDRYDECRKCGFAWKRG